MPVDHEFPEALVYEPASGIHRHTVILLHGRGGSADAFGPALLRTALPLAGAGSSVLLDVMSDDSVTHDPSRNGVGGSGKLPNGNNPRTLAEALPHARFVFPNAPKQRATVYRRSIIRQWFDDWHLGFTADEVDSRYDFGLQTAGLGSTVARLHGQIAEEAGLVGGARNIVLGGISQGCAASLVASLLWEGERLGGVIGMCGWLPYISQMTEQLALGGELGGTSRAAVDEEETTFDPFDRSDSPGRDAPSPSDIGTRRSAASALDWLREELEMPESRPAASDAPRSSVPALLCHGRDDEKVDLAKGVENAEFLPAIGMGPTCFKEFAGVGHDFSAQMLLEVAKFVQNVLGST